MKRATARIAERHFNFKLKTGRRDELGALGGAINRMSGRLQTLTETRKRFLGDAAHELRSPIARTQVASEILERTSQPSSQKYIDALKEDLKIMTHLTDELLQLARAELAMQPAQLLKVNVAEAVKVALQQESGAGQIVRIDIAPMLEVHADRQYLIRAVSNILRNAFRYAAGYGPIEISASRLAGLVEIHIADSRPGVPDEALDKIFMPFYRLDETRDRKTGGTSLGLAIVRTCVEACGGTVECSNRVPHGPRVTLRFKASTDH